MQKVSRLYREPGWRGLGKPLPLETKQALEASVTVFLATINLVIIIIDHYLCHQQLQWQRQLVEVGPNGWLWS